MILKDISSHVTILPSRYRTFLTPESGLLKNQEVKKTSRTRTMKFFNPMPLNVVVV